MGKATFFHLTDQTGRLQVYAKRDDLGDDGYEVVKLIDAGDFCGRQGAHFPDKNREPSVHAEAVTILSRAFVRCHWKREGGQVWYGLTDVEALPATLRRPGGYTLTRRVRRCGRSSFEHCEEMQRPVHRGRNARPAAAVWRRGGASVHHAP